MAITSDRNQRPRETRRPAPRGELPDYYIAPSHDFTQYTRDYEEKYWSQDTAFDWEQSIRANLDEAMHRATADTYERTAARAIPLVDQALELAIADIERYGLPLDDDGLRAVGECLPDDRPSIAEAVTAQEPLDQLDVPVARLSDRLAILEREQIDLKELHRLKLFQVGTEVRPVASAEERRQQSDELEQLGSDIDAARDALKEARQRNRLERRETEASVRRALDEIEPRVLEELRKTRAFVATAGPRTASRSALLDQLIVKRQVRGLKDIANHALVVEQSAIAPLTTGVIQFKRRREMQEAMTTFVNDEAKHSAVFRRYMADKLDAKERIPAGVLKGADRYLWLARVMPSGAIFLAVVIESIGGAYLEFFSRERNMPEPLFRSICETIAMRDEKRHQDLCAATYNELYRSGTRWERLRNRMMLKVTLQSAYGDKSEDHHLIQACRSFGCDPPYRFIAENLSAQLRRVGTHVSPDWILEFMPYASSDDD